MQRIPVAGGQLPRESGRSRVERLDSQKGPMVSIQQIQAIAMACASDTGDLLGRDPGAGNAAADHRAGVGPQLVEIALDMAGLGTG